MAIGQIWYGTSGTGDDARIVRVNNDGTGQTTVIDDNPAAFSGNPSGLGLDTARGFYFAILNGNSNGLSASLVRGSISGGALTTLVSYTAAGTNITANSIVNNLIVDPLTNRIFVGIQDPNAGTGSGTNSGIRQYTYDNAGNITDNGFIVTYATANKPAGGSFELFNPLDFAYDRVSNTIYFSETLTGGAAQTGLFRLNLANPNVVTQVVDQNQFPDNGINGRIRDVEVDGVRGNVFFATRSTSPVDGGSYDANDNGIWRVATGATNATATRVSLTGAPSDFYPDDITFDAATNQLYVESEGTNASNADDLIYVFQLSADGLSGSLLRTITPAAPNSTFNIDSLTFSDLPDVAIAAGAAFFEGSAPATVFSGATVSDSEGLLRGATVQLTTNYNNATDTLIYTAQNGISGTYSNGTLTLSGVATVAQYQTAIRSITFSASGDNPTNFGAAATRGVTVTLDDGTPAVPAGSSNSTTATFAVTGVNDAPVFANLNGDVLTYTRGQAGQKLDQGTGAAITDADSANFDTGSLSVVVSNALSGDALEFTFTAGYTITNPSGNSYQLNYLGTQIGTLTVNSAANWTFGFNANATPALVSGLISTVYFSSTSFTSGTRNVVWTLNDGDGNANGGVPTATVSSSVNYIVPAPSFSVSDVSAAEGTGGTTTFTFTVTMTGTADVAYTVNYATADGTALAGSDYTATSGTLTFPATTNGTTTQTVSVTVNPDAVFEANQTFFVNLSGASGGATISDSQGVGTIVNDDAAPTFAINDVTVNEADGTATFTVTRTGATELTSTVNYATQNGTATAVAGGPGTPDYTTTSGTLTFAPSLAATATQTFTVAITNDAVFEGTEQFAANLTSAVNATIADSQGIGTIVDNDTPPVFTINDVSVSEGNSGTKLLTFTVTMTGASATASTVDFTTADGTATAGTDYVATSGTLTFPATANGTTTQTVTVVINGDTVFEGDQTLFLNLSNANGATIGDTQGVGTITNDDAAPTLTVNDVTVNEAAGTATFTVTRTGATEQGISVNYATSDGTAVVAAGGPGTPDYTAASGTLTFAPSLAATATQTVTVAITNDTVYEAVEQFAFNLSGATGATIADAQGIGTITNDDAAPVITIGDVTIVEGNSGTTNAVFTVTLTGATALPISVNFATADGTALAGSDYVATSGTLTFAPTSAGTTTLTISVPVNGDTIFEGDQQFALNLSGATNGATIGDAQGVATITNDDTAPTFAISDVTVSEGGTATFTVTRTGATEFTSSVDYATQNGTATTVAGGPGTPDYTATSGTLTFAPSLAATATQTFTVATTNDAVFEATEQFSANLSNAVNATIADSQGIGTITDNDAPPSFTINDVTLAEGNNGTTAFTFTVTMTGATAAPVTIDFATADGTATTATNDYVAQTGTLTFPATTSGTSTQTVTILVNGDVTFESAQQFAVNLSNPSNGATIADGQGIGTITNDDAAPLIAINDIAVNEADGTATFTVTRTGATEFGSTVTYSTADGTAVSTAGGPGTPDYTATSGSVTIAASTAATATQTITVNITNDAVYEATEQFAVNLNSVTNAIFADAQGIATITDNDAAPTITVSDVTVTEGNSGTTAATFTVTLTGATALPISVNYATANGTATAGSDYTAASGTLTFNPTAAGTSTLTVTVLVSGDTAFEPNETFFLNLSGATNGATIADNQGLGTINNDDNSPPVVTVPAGTTAFVESGSGPSTPVVVANNVTATDVDNATLASATAAITANFVSGQDVLAFTNTNATTFGNIAASYNAATGVLTLTSAGATATTAQFTAALRAVTYTNSSDTPNTATRTVSFTVNDGTSSSTAGTRDVTVTATNDAPVNTVPGTSTTVNEDSVGNTSTAPVNAIAGLSISDVDAGTAVVKVTLSVTNGTLNVRSDAAGGVTAGEITGNGTASVVLTSTIAKINATLGAMNGGGLANGLVYTPTANFNGIATLTILTDDQGNTGQDPGLTGTPTSEADSDTVTIVVTSINDAPSGTSATLTAVEDTARAFTAADFGFSDPADGNAFAGVVITTLPTAGTLRLNGTAVIAGQFVAVADLPNLTFTAAQDANGAAYASFTFQVRDNGGTANGGVDTDQSADTITFNVTAVNDAPVAAAAGPAVGYTERTPAVVVSSTITVADVDSTTLARATVTIGAGRQAGDVLGFVNQSGITGSYDATTGVLTLTGVTSLANYQAALRSVTFANLTNLNPTAGGTAPTRTISFVLNDGAADSTSVTKTINVTAIDDASTAQPDAFALIENGAITGDLRLNNGSGADTDPDGPVEMVTRINGATFTLGTGILLPSGALLTIQADGTFLYDTNLAYVQLAAPGSGASNTQATDTFTYTLQNGSTATVTVRITGSDNTDTLLGTSGNDTLSAGALSDVLIGGLGADAMDGGSGIDTVSYEDNFGAVSLDLRVGRGYTNAAFGDTYVNIENVRGSSFGDYLIGGFDNNVLEGMGGDDVLIGSLGADVLNGGDGTDFASYEDNQGAVFIDLYRNAGFGNAAQGDTFVSIENLRGSIFGDTLMGDSAINRLEGLAGDDVLIGGLGADVLVGGDGSDTVSYEENWGMVTADLNLGRGFGNAAQGDIYVGIENARGGQFADTLIGDAGANRLMGGLGNDTLVGNGGADTFVFDSALAPSPNVDRILDFTGGVDKIELKATVFANIALGTLSSAAFGLGTVATTADQRILYDGATGNLWYDADGVGGTAAVLFATLTTNPTMVATDFIVVA